MMTLLRTVASLRLTLVGLVLLAAALLAYHNLGLPGAWTITPALALLGVNLAAAMVVDPRFRRRPALFAFHLCLLLLAGLAGYGQLAAYQARLSLVEGQDYAGELLERLNAGPLAPPLLADGAFRQVSVEVDYTSGLRRGSTRSRVDVAQRGRLEVGDDVPLIVDGHRFYTTSNKGFAALLLWRPEVGDAQLGAVRFPSYPISELGQLASWRTPAGQELELALALPPSPYNETWTLRTAIAGDAEIRLKLDGRRLTLRPGESVALDGGRLDYQRLGMWIGYEVRYNPTLSWLFSLAALAVIFMAVHFASRILQPARAGAVDGRGQPA
ncbi:MAG: hypothetical protein QNJ91_17445 [Gammaproteobacteria bacterium]|nr:hypothetical protein [Gammaproteobacteria bacterium]